MSLRLFTRLIDDTRSERISVVGNLVYMRTSTAQVLVTCSQNRPGFNGRVLADRSPLSESQKIRTVPELFDNVIIENVSGGQVALSMIIGVGDYDAPLADVDVTIPNAIGTVEDVDVDNVIVTQVLPADPTRERAHIKSRVSNDVEIRVGDANVSATRGAQLQPGEGITIAGDMEIIAIAEGLGVSFLTITTELKT